METHLGRMSLADAEERLATKPVVLMPFGALEAHGPHLPLGADYLVAEEISLRASRRTHAVVVPVMPYGYSPAFRGFAGTVSVRPEITRMLAEDIFAGLAEIGITHFVLVDNHGGNDAPLELAARGMQERLPLAVAHYYPWQVMSTWGSELFGTDWKTVYGHGAEPNTSVLLHLMPEAVRMDRAVRGGVTPFRGQQMVSTRQVEIGGVRSQLYLSGKTINESSVTAGDPTRPNPEIGETLVARTTDGLVRLIEWFQSVLPTHGRERVRPD